MLTYKQALKLILENTSTLGKEILPLTNCVGRILASSLYSPINMPPFNKSAMDGYALKSADTKKTIAKLKCLGLIQAGETFNRKINRGECIKIMTGANIPRGSDSVIMVEDTKQTLSSIEIGKGVEKGENICLQGEDIKAGQKILEKGAQLNISHISLLATLGKKCVTTIKAPKVAVLNTGGEIVACGKKLPKNKIYNSNGPQHLALITQDTIKPLYLGIAKDKPKELEAAIKKGLKNDILLISGGVSMGDYDLVPEILKKLGVKQIFHKVKIKPGKPLFFGIKGKTLVFGIPGNPVSNFLAYILFIRPAIRKIMGYKFYSPRFGTATLKETIENKNGRAHFILARIFEKNNIFYAKPIISHGSADILALSKANSFLVVETDGVAKTKSKIKFITW